MATIIDRRLNPRDKTIKNRQKFIERTRDQIKKSVKDSIDSGNIADIENGKIRVRVKGTSEPEFKTDPKTGNRRYVMPGNDQYVVNDTVDKPEDGGGQGGNQGGLGRSEDDFEFILNKEEYLDFIFDDLELPDLVKKQIKDVKKIKMKRAGYSNQGNPSQLDVVRSLKNSLGRRIGLARPKNEEIEQLEQELEQARAKKKKKLITELEERIAELKRRQVAVPWLDPFDVRYRNFVPNPEPITQAVMFCVLDVSGSMGQTEKDIAKRFFFLLYMFLHKKYEKIDIVFIRHHEVASEVEEEEFFKSRESGGTVVSEAIKLVKKIIDERYSVSDWNIYVAQGSDGDNYQSDYNNTLAAMRSLLPVVQYYAYLEIVSHFKVQWSILAPTELRKAYTSLEKSYSNINIQQATTVKDIWRAFKKLFSKEKEKATK